MKQSSRLLSTLLLVAFTGHTLLHGDERKSADQQQATAEQLTFVRSKVLPLLEARCFQCHRDAKEVKGGLHMGSRSSLVRGGDSGPAIVPGKPDESLLVEAIRYESLEMPPRSKMPAQEIDILVRWIREGAHWPADMETSAPKPTTESFPLEQRRRSHWAWQPVTSPPTPSVKASDWLKDSLDAFIVARLQEKNLSPAPDADRPTILRRLYFDLIGMPPSVEQTRAFMNDSRSDDEAMRAVVDELLRSPHFGERWGRHWLDLVRYAETLGHEFDYPLHNAWRYRDYVIRALNQDVPYDQFVREHVAGDLLQNPRRHPTEQFNESVIGTGFWFLCEDKHSPVDVKAEEAAKIDNQLDVFSKTFLGMTVACARCHDHKFDAISTKDYYALSGFLQSSRRQTAWLDHGRKIEARVKALHQIRNRVMADIESKRDAANAQTELQTHLQTLISAALELVHGKPAPGESADAGFSRSTAAVAAKFKCESKSLQQVAGLLLKKENLLTDRLMSLPASLAQSQGPVADRVRQWQSTAMAVHNPSETTPFADLRNGLPGDWFALGHAFDNLTPDTPSGLEWRKDGLQFNGRDGVSSATLSKELRGTLMSPTFELKHPEILVRVAGQGARMRLIIDGYQMYEFNGLLFGGAKVKIDTDGEFQWLRFGGDMHRYQGHRMHIEFLDEGNGWFNVAEVRFANRRGAQPPAYQQTSRLNRQLAAALPKQDMDAETAIAQWAAAVSTDTRMQAEAAFNSGLVSSTAIEEWKEQASGIPAPVPVIAITDGSEEDEFVFIRGSHKNLGEVAPRQILTALRSGDSRAITKGSGRLELANRLVASDNPLVARVAVNRIWHHLMGRGIVESTDNFGVLGKRPTHPHLLDHLATRFRRNNWSVKSLIRDIVLSRTYRMSSDRRPDAVEADPTNALFHRADIRRLQGESVRDGILTVSGRLDRTQFGSPVPVHLTPFMQGRGRPRQNGPLDGNGRRSIYIAVNRNFLSPFMLAFDVPAPVTTTGRRTVSNVPAQALIMLNNEFVNQQARVWAEKLLAAKPQDNRQLLEVAWFELFSRPATDSDLEPLLSFAGAETDGGLMPAETLTELCHVLLNSKEFLFLR